MGSKTIKCFFVANGSYKRLVIPPLVRDGIGIEKEIHFLCPPKQAISKMLKKRAPRASKPFFACTFFMPLCHEKPSNRHLLLPFVTPNDTIPPLLALTSWITPPGNVVSFLILAL